MSTVTNIKTAGSVVSWEADGAPQSITLPGEVTNALALRSGGVAVIVGNDWRATASLLNADGSLRVELKNPYPPERGMAFYYFNYEGDTLVVVLAGTTRDFRCRIDELTGEMSSPIETR